jgi:hypothetical protein
MHYLLTTPVLMDDSALQRLMGRVPKTSYANGIKTTFDDYGAEVPDTAHRVR